MQVPISERRDSLAILLRPFVTYRDRETRKRINAEKAENPRVARNADSPDPHLNASEEAVSLTDSIPEWSIARAAIPIA